MAPSLAPDWTARRKALLLIANRLLALTGELDQNLDLEDLHDQAQGAGSYSGACMRMCELANSARQAAAEVPNPRRRPALPFAAEAFIWLRYWNGFPRVSSYVDGTDVEELKCIAERAGIVVSEQRISGALAKAMKTFDRHMVPPHMFEYFF